MRVLLVDDHTLFLEGLKNFLIANDIDVVGTAEDGTQALAKVYTLKPDVILMDVQMPDGGGIKATRIIKDHFPDVKIVMLTVSQDADHLFEAIKAGASGYLLKGLGKEQFLDLLAGLAEGECPLSPGMAAKVLAEFTRLQREKEGQHLTSNQMDLLSGRQIEILKLVAHGLTYKQIGTRINLSEAAIKYHMAAIASRLHLENRSQVIAFAAESGLATSKESSSKKK